MPPPPLFARRLTALRLAAGFETQSALAEETGLTAAAISGIENGTSKGRDETFASLCRVLGPRQPGEPICPLSAEDASAWWLLRLEPAATR